MRPLAFAALLLVSWAYRDAACSDPVAYMYDEEHLPRIAYQSDGEFWKAAYEVLADAPRDTKIYRRYADDCGDDYLAKVLPLGRAIALESFRARIVS